MHPDRSWATGRVAGVLVAVAMALALDDLSYVTSFIYDEGDERGALGIDQIVFIGIALVVAGLAVYFLIPKITGSVKNSANCISNPAACAPS
jgi:hypothetical protein